MKNKYTRATVALFIGLLSFNTFSSYVDTRQASYIGKSSMQIFDVENTRQNLGMTKDRLQTSYNANPKKCVGYTVLWLMAGLGTTGIGIWGVPKLLSGSNMISSNDNHSMPTTLGPWLVSTTGNSSDSMPTTLGPWLVSTTGNNSDSMPTTLGPLLVSTTGNNSDSMPTTLGPWLVSTTGISPAQLDELERIVKPALDAPPFNNDSAISPLSPDPVYATELPSSSFMPTPNSEAFNATECGDIEATIQRWIDEGKDVNEPDKFGKKLLTWASVNGCIEGVKRLIESGADPNAKDAKGITPLIAAVANDQDEKDKLELVQYLIDNGSQADVEDADGKTALSYAQSDSIKALLKRQSKYAESDSIRAL